MRIGIGLNVVSGQGLDKTLIDFLNRVSGDSGTSASTPHLTEVINDIRSRDLFNANDLLLLNTASAGKADILYSLYAFTDYNTWLTRVTAGDVADTDFVIDTLQGIQRRGVYDEVKLLTICAAGDAGNLYSFKPVITPTFTGILDTYSGAAAAYSVRRLSSSYSGAAVRVRESSGGTETDIGFNGENLDETALLAHCGANDGFVTKWYDQSGNSNDAIQGTALSQPKIVSAGTVVKENGKPSLDYNVVGMELPLTSRIDLGVANFSINMVYRSTRTSSEDYVLFGDSAQSRFRLYDNKVQIYIDSAIYEFPSLSNFGSQYLYTVEADNLRGLQVYRNSTPTGSELTISTGNGFIQDYIGYGSTRPIQGRLQEVIIYPSDQSANRTGIEANINAYFSIYP